MRLIQFEKDLRTALGELYGEREASAILAVLCEDLCGISRLESVLNPSRELAPQEEKILKEAGQRLLAWEPVQYVTGSTFFAGNRFKLSPSVLIPRPETEEMVCLASSSAFPGARILDLCTGSGCIAWSLAQKIRNSRVTAVDISPDSLEIAASQELDCPSPRFIQADILRDNFLPEDERFDMIISNPPYILESERQGMLRNVLDYEPSIALFVSDSDPLVFYRAIARIGSRHLAPGGRGFVEINSLLGEETVHLFEEAGFAEVELHSDMSGRDRFITFLSA